MFIYNVCTFGSIKIAKCPPFEKQMFPQFMTYVSSDSCLSFSLVILICVSRKGVCLWLYLDIAYLHFCFSVRYTSWLVGVVIGF